MEKTINERIVELIEGGITERYLVILELQKTFGSVVIVKWILQQVDPNIKIKIISDY